MTKGNLTISICLLFTFTGETGLGKSTLINSLFLMDLYKDRKVDNIEGTYLEFLSSIYMYTVNIGMILV